MSTIGSIVDTRRDRILSEVETVLWHDNPDLHRHGREAIARVVNMLLDALITRVRIADDPLLGHIMS